MKIVLIVSGARSGNEFFLSLLDNHSQIMQFPGALRCNDNLLNILSNNSDKISIIEVGKKPLYSDIFRYILNNLKDKNCMIINADIY